MEFVLNGQERSLDAEIVRARVRAAPPDPIRAHWVEVDGQRWPPKQAFRIATGITDEPFVSHFAMRIFRRLGFTTSPIPGDSRVVAPAVAAVAPPAPGRTGGEAVAAFERLDGFLSSGSLTAVIAALERDIDGADREAAARVLKSAGLDEDLVDSALIVRERIGMIDTLIHAAVITQVLPRILEPGETVARRPSLGAGNDPDRAFDLETTHRVAEFKLSSWNGQDGMRQRSLFADVVGLSLDTSGRRRQVFVVGDLPVRFLRTSGRDASKTLSKAALKLRTPDGLSEGMTVAEFTQAAQIDVVDLRNLIPKLR
jgi:hypothetical protein